MLVGNDKIKFLYIEPGTRCILRGYLYNGVLILLYDAFGIHGIDYIVYLVSKFKNSISVVNERSKFNRLSYFIFSSFIFRLGYLGFQVLIICLTLSEILS